MCVMIKMKSNWFNEVMVVLIILRYGGCLVGCLWGFLVVFFFGLINCIVEDFFFVVDVVCIDCSYFRDLDVEELEIDCWDF